MLPRIYHCLVSKAKQPLITSLMALVIAMSNVGVVDTSQAAINTSPVGSGFTVTPADLAYILQQIKIAEAHVVAPNPDLIGDPDNCQALIGPGSNQLPNNLVSFGLRTVDGSCNNLVPGQEKHGAADQAFPRLTVPNFERPAEARPANLVDFPPSGPTNFNQTSGFVYDSQPRMISNLIVDQTSTNLAAVAAAGFPVRTQGNPGIFPCDENGEPVGCVPSFETLFIPNVTTDVGLSPPFNSLFTIFGQFFDHGLDKITNGGNGQVVVPLRDDDPLICGNDHVCGGSNAADDIPPNLRFMAITRGHIVNGPDGFRSAPNTDTPFVDQSQTYTSHSSHQVFTREYDTTPTGPVATGKFLSEADGGIATWATIKAQAATKLGIELVDADVTNIPMVLTDVYGNFKPGPNGLPQLVTDTGLIEGNTTTEPVKANCPAVGPGCPAVYTANRIDTAFLNDISHSASPGSIASPNTPDSNLVAGGSLDPVAHGEYDNELLDLHFICGDGRCNENIALTAIHQVFHMEHDRLATEFDTITLPANASLQSSYNNTNCPIGCATNNPALPTTFTYGQRLFQAARFVTEMQYQHLVFEEFARKVQPLINPFEAFAFNQTDIDPAITAEFAHAVYRFGHSMLTDTVPRKNANGSICANPSDIPDSPACLNNDIPLFDAFLNPAEFNNGGVVGTLSAPNATGAIIMGLSDQVGQEIDEFVAEAVRNHLLGLPQDLPAINMTRARSEGIPSLNNVRKQIFAATNDGQLAPYTNWINFQQRLKHPESLVNFIAAYGTHPIIATLDPDGSGPIQAGSLEARRMAADQIVSGTTLPGPDGTLGDDPSTPAVDESVDDIFAPVDIGDFVFSTNSPGCVAPTPNPTASPICWENVGDVSQTGLDDVDLWVGGLAENTNLFGGLLGPTFNYVFEKQLTDLQNGDRFYYLARTPGMNLRSQLEGNSFAELVMRNTNAHTLKADPFATADCKFEKGNLTFPASPGSFITGPGSVNDDPTTDCDENLLLLRQPNGQILYRAINSVDTPGINGQGVYNGTDDVDNFLGGNDNDTFWGGLGNDIIDGNGGDDVILGGEGDDIITDFAGNDFLKGGPGNDAIDGGVGDDIIIAGAGKDFTNGGANINETFSGEGDDFAIAGQGTDAVFGDSGDDWEEGGDQPDLLIGDSSTLFFDDHNLPGHDILIGQGGDDDYDMEGGDDIGVAGPGVEKNAGAAGYDWSIGQGDPQLQNADLDLPIVNAPPANEVRDRFNEVEALSGWNFNDTLRGDSVVPSQVGGIGFIGCDALDADGVARIGGLDAIVPASIRTVDPAETIAAAVTNYCGLEGPIWGEGNILLGGGGSDTIEGRGADDIIDGDHMLRVRISVRSGVDANDLATGPEIASTDLMENIPTGPGWTGALAGKTLQAAVFAGLVNPGQLVAVREIVAPDGSPMGASANTSTASDCPAPAVTQDLSLTHNCDTAWFSNPSANYTITTNADGSITVTDNSAVTNDGIDTLWNIEQLSFCATPDAVVKTLCAVREVPIPVAPVASVSPASVDFGSVTVGLTPPVRNITVSNGGLGQLTVTGVSLTGADTASFLVPSTNPCTAPLVHGGTPCIVPVQFAPTTTGSKSANVVITGNSGPGSPTITTIVPLTGTGVVPTVSVTVGGVPASTLDFGNVNTNTTSATRTVVLTNTSAISLTINNIQVQGTGFARVAAPAPSCGATLAPGVACNINVRFSPGATTGQMTGSITITDNAVPSPQIVTLIGTGVVQLPVAQVAPAALDFGNVVVGSAFNIPVTLTNTGTGATPMTINSIQVSSGTGFSRVTVAGGAVAPNCGTSLAAGASCNITVRFAPTTALGTGAKTGTLTITDNSNNILGSQQIVGLSGFAAISATVDATTVAASGVVTPQVISRNVRANDVPNVAASVVSIVSSSFTNGGATAVATVTASTLTSGNNSITWTLTPTGANAAARAASKRGTYTVNYKLTNVTATATATYTLTVN
ncbi:hypothetical protein MGMO_81c00010 [Methyloglobulus morosus KoM1]|uniref:HYDIN/VesB/CFA65-like Ig-like domain-containing protein n=1 Tax=Methyloglobulus morosus KoM1 TaxID=1116472 RepID=V5BF80_9GAMM|nr:peroxidase family protein [Methyloglobulus morosus]ESS71955.1 hypothetical protein MGMO_81c00010 [Methyloglobulus morosus KoM1]